MRFELYFLFLLFYCKMVDLRRVLSFDMGSRNMAYALVEEPHTLICWGMIDLGVNQARQATENLIDLLESDAYRWMRENHAYDVVVEQQPANGVCKTLAHALQTYFRTSDLLNPACEKPRSFHFMAAHSKLKFDVDIYDKVRPETHAERKIVSMRVVEEYLDREGEAYKFYGSRNHKQQTDLADAYIQGCQELKKMVSGKKRTRAAQFKPSRYTEKEHFSPKSANTIKHSEIEWDLVDFVAT